MSAVDEPPLRALRPGIARAVAGGVQVVQRDLVVDLGVATVGRDRSGAAAAALEVDVRDAPIARGVADDERAVPARIVEDGPAALGALAPAVGAHAPGGAVQERAIAGEGVAALEQHALAAAEVGRGERGIEARVMQHRGARRAAARCRPPGCRRPIRRWSWCPRIRSSLPGCGRSLQLAARGVAAVVRRDGRDVGRIGGGHVEVSRDSAGGAVAAVVARIRAIAPALRPRGAVVAEVPAVSDILKGGRAAGDRAVGRVGGIEEHQEGGDAGARTIFAFSASVPVPGA